MTVLDELADGEGVAVSIARGKALVSHVEERHVTHLSADLGDLLPLLRGGVDTGRVVSTSVEEENATRGGITEVGNHAIEVKANSVLVVVAVLLDLDSGVLEDGLVVSPRRGGDADDLLARVPTVEELGANTKSTSTRDGLGRGNPVEGGGIRAVGQLDGGLGEFGNTSDTSILLVHLLLDDGLLSLADRGQDVGLASIVAVGTDTCKEPY
mgnify:CR=1 FL=1